MSRSLRTSLDGVWRWLTGPVSIGKRNESFKGSEISRLTADWFARTQRADEEIKKSQRKLRGRARDLSRNSSTVRYFRNLLATNVIGPRGMRLQAQFRQANGEPDTRTNRAFEEAWREFAASKVTVDGRLTLTQLEQLVAKTVATDGECFVRIYRGYPNRFGMALQIIDADQIDEQLNREPGGGKNEVRLGVEVNALGAPVAYYVHDERRGLPSALSAHVRIPAADMIHNYVSERAYQTRGVTWMHSAMFPLKMREGYVEAELVAARVSAAKMGFIQQRQDALVGEVTGDGGTPPTHELMEANAGSFETLDPGYEVVPFDPQHPTTAFAPFLKAILRDVASGFGVSYNALANDLEGVNFSSMRSGLLQERDLWKAIQEWIISDLKIPVYREWANAALLSGAIALPAGASRDWRNYTRVRFIPRGWAWVDPMKDVQASAIGISAGLTSRQQVLAEQGLDWEETMEQLAQEQEKARELGISIDPPGSTGTTAPEVDPDDDSDKNNSTGEEEPKRDLGLQHQ